MTLAERSKQNLANYRRIVNLALADGYHVGDTITVLSTATSVTCKNGYGIDGARLTAYRLQWSADGRALIWKLVSSGQKRPAYVFGPHDYDQPFCNLKRYE